MSDEGGGGGGAIGLYQQYKALITVPGVDASEAAEAAGLPADISTILADIDFVKAATDQSAVKAIWKEKFGR